MSDITGQQKSFIDEYIKFGRRNQTQAAINAGYSPKSAESQASQLLKNPKVSAYLEERENDISQAIKREFIFDALEAKKVMAQLMNDDDVPENVRLSAAKDFLDRAGFKPVEKQETEINGQLDISNKSDVINKYLKSDADDS